MKKDIDTLKLSTYILVLIIIIPFMNGFVKGYTGTPIIPANSLGWPILGLLFIISFSCTLILYLQNKKIKVVK